MPLSVEIYKENKWIKVGCINPRDKPGSISDNKPNGTRDIYIFKCVDDSKSIIYRSITGLDTEIKDARLLTIIGAEVVKELKREDSPYEMRIKTDRSLETILIRFAHI